MNPQILKSIALQPRFWALNPPLSILFPKILFIKTQFSIVNSSFSILSQKYRILDSKCPQIAWFLAKCLQALLAPLAQLAAFSRSAEESRQGNLHKSSHFQCFKFVFLPILHVPHIKIWISNKTHFIQIFMWFVTTQNGKIHFVLILGLSDRDVKT